VRVCVVEEW
jgi:transposase